MIGLFAALIVGCAIPELAETLADDKMKKGNVEMAVRRKSPLRGKQIVVRLQPDELQAVDAWAAKQKPPVTRPEAIRCMIDIVRRTSDKGGASARQTSSRRMK